MKLTIKQKLLIGLLVLNAFSASAQSVDTISIKKWSIQPQKKNTLSQISDSSKSFKIKWVKRLNGDFSFTENWDYPLGVAMQENGKAGCADGGFCPQECYEMMDEDRNINPDSIERFYQLLDTSHLYHTLKCDAWCYEWAGSNYMHAKRRSGDLVACNSETGIATHCSLLLFIKGDTCWAIIDLNSVTPNGSAFFYAYAGYIYIDKKAWKKNILKASFSFDFKHPGRPEKRIYWNGLIQTPIKDTN